jgi:tetrapyrrole methylase family protein / MazG family protein
MSSIETLIQIVKDLRAPDGCPWDKEQTLKSITPYILEEAYELVDAIENGSITDVKEELGDALLHVVMLSNIAEDDKQFNVYDVADHVGKKMIHRHPHVFGDTKVKDVDEVWKNWEELKKEEKPESTSVMDSIPKHFPALLQASKIQKRASRLGFDWANISGPFDKMTEEIAELKEEYEQKNIDKDRLEDEAGDVLFSMCNILRHMKINPEEALRKSNEKFIQRFKKVEALSKQDTKGMRDMSESDMNAYWDLAKKDIKLNLK